MPAAALSRLIRGKFKDAMKKAELFQQIPKEVWSVDWVVHIKALPQCETAIKYVAPYIFKVAISDHRIIKIDRGKVIFSYREQGTHLDKLMSLDGIEFLRRFLQHVLPNGFMKVRHYGFLSGNCNVTIEDIHSMIFESTGQAPKEPEPVSTRTSEAPYCPDCGSPLVYLWSEIPTSNDEWIRIYPRLKDPPKKAM